MVDFVLANTDQAHINLDVGTLTAIALAILLAISGLVQRSTAKRQVVVECPNRVQELWPEIQRMADQEDEASECCAEVRMKLDQVIAAESARKERADRLLAAVNRIEVKLNGRPR